MLLSLLQSIDEPQDTVGYEGDCRKEQKNAKK
jgi:hypothetical protein